MKVTVSISANEKLTSKQEKAKKLSQILDKQDFADFYNEGGDFDAWIRGEEDCPSDVEIYDTIARIFKL